MAKKYLLGADVEKDITKQKARLLGIAHECYVQRVQDKGTDYVQNEYVTMYGAILKAKKYSETEFLLEFDNIESLVDDYAKLPSVHKAKVKDAEDLSVDEWDLT